MEDSGDFKLPYPDRLFTRQTRIGIGIGTVGTDTTYRLNGETPVQIEKTGGFGAGLSYPPVNFITSDVAGTGGSGLRWEGPALATNYGGITWDGKQAAGGGVSIVGVYIDVDEGLARRMVKSAWSN